MVDGWKRGFAGRLTAEHEYLRQVPTRHRHPGGAAQLRPPHPRLPARLVDHPCVGPSAGRAADIRLAGPHRLGRRRVGRRAVPAGRARARPRRSSSRCARSTTRPPPGSRRRSSRWRRPRSGSRCRPTDTSPGSPRGASRCWRWRCSRRVRVPALAAGGAGLLLGWAIFLNYGLALIAFPALAVLLTARRRDALTRACRRDTRGAGRGRGLRLGRLLVVRRLHPCAATILAGHRNGPPVPVLELGQSGVGGLRDRPRQRRRGQQGVRRRGDPSPVRHPPAACSPR